MLDSTKRFSSRVDDYAQYRPRYPREVIERLRDECGLTAESPVADIGSGTGFLSELFLRNGNPVYAVEPNPEMREAGEKLLAGFPGFRSIDGRAEATGLPACSVDFVITGQAFHWFDVERSRSEFIRILRPGGTAMIVWNEREIGTTPFLEAYEDLLRRHVPDYTRLNFSEIYEVSVADFFGEKGFRSGIFRNRQEFDLEGAKGRLLSSSYTPEEGHPNHIPMLEALKEAFYTHQSDGRVTFLYTTRMYYGPLQQRIRHRPSKLPDS
ncbi:MAG: class I SAM-dependent methyltransferase [Acidobacteria bacterium]|nr:class I SAM-dependent methyltransferase [Acidobacteriota bacterium]